MRVSSQILTRSSTSFDRTGQSCSASSAPVASNASDINGTLSEWKGLLGATLTVSDLSRANSQLLVICCENSLPTHGGVFWSSYTDPKKIKIFNQELFDKLATLPGVTCSSTDGATSSFGQSSGQQFPSAFQPAITNLTNGARQTVGRTLKDLMQHAGVMQDLEIQENYKGNQSEHHGKVEFYMREPLYAGFNVKNVITTELRKLNIKYTQSDTAKYGGILDQIFLEQYQYASLKTKLGL